MIDSPPIRASKLDGIVAGFMLLCLCVDISGWMFEENAKLRNAKHVSTELRVKSRVDIQLRDLRVVSTGHYLLVRRSHNPPSSRYRRLYSIVWAS